MRKYLVIEKLDEDGEDVQLINNCWHETLESAQKAIKNHISGEDCEDGFIIIEIDKMFNVGIKIEPQLIVEEVQ